jgi:hypothetical protein
MPGVRDGEPLLLGKLHQIAVAVIAVPALPALVVAGGHRDHLS